MADPRIQLYHNLSTLLAAGVPLHRALTAAPPRGRFGRLFAEIAASVSHSESLAEAVESRRRRFEPLDATLIRVGEDTGNLAEVFAMLAEWYTFRQQIRRVIGSGLVLPAVMVHLLALLAPVPSYALGGWDIRGYVVGVVMILAMFYLPTAVILGVIYLTPKRGLLRAWLDTFVYTVPVLGRAVRDLSLSRYSKVFGIALKSGLPIVKSAELALDIASNAVVRCALRGGLAAVKKGNQMSEGFSRRLPGEFLELWKVGEETGDLDDCALRLGKLFGENADRGFQSVAAWTPRLVYAIVAGVMVYHILKGFSHIYGNLGTLEL